MPLNQELSLPKNNIEKNLPLLNFKIAYKKIPQIHFILNNSL